MDDDDDGDDEDDDEEEDDDDYDDDGPLHGQKQDILYYSKSCAMSHGP